MRITSFEPVAVDLQNLGLGKVQFRKLGRLVVLAGPNGGGKSRILKALRDTANGEGQRLRSRQMIVRDLPKLQIALRQARDGQQQEQYSNQIRKHEDTLRRLDSITLDRDVETIRVVSFVPKDLNLADPGVLTRADLIERARRAREPDLNKLNGNALAYIQKVQDRFWEASHPLFQNGDEERDSHKKEYERLCEVLDLLLGQKLTRSADSDALLGGRKFGKLLLSDGEKVLLQLAVAVHPVRNDEALILSMDEPENHLHPSALVKVFDRIREVLPRAQVWVATHSVPLIAHLYAEEPESLHFVEGGSVTHAGTKPTLVLEGLLGKEDEQIKLLNFLDLPWTLAAQTFAVSCLLPPGVAEHQQNDRQLEQIRKMLRANMQDGRPLRILDLGAGKGRLLAGLQEEFTRADIDYVAYDTSAKDRPGCERQIEAVYQTAAQRWFSDRDQLFTAHGEGAFDAVVLCNVLHEIPPDDWLDLIGPRGLVTKALGAKGHLLIVEDLRIPVGELPHAQGFFLLDSLHLQKLFRCDPSSRDLFLSADADGKERLKAHAIRKELVERATAQSRLEALEDLRDTAMRRMKELRQSADRTYKNGHLHSLWGQQFANCSLYLKSQTG